MSSIRYENGTNIAIYSVILQAAITDIKEKLGIVDDEIEWIIFDENDHLKNKFINKSLPSFVFQKDYKYGFCFIDKKEIWISTAAIMTSKVNDFQEKIPKIVFKQENKEIFLINVILDELAHITTGKDHGNEKYDATLKKYYRQYYRQQSCFSLD